MSKHFPVPDLPEDLPEPAQAQEYHTSELELQRRSFRRKQTGKSIFISLLSTAVLAGALVLVLARSSGWQAVKKTFFSSHYFMQALPSVAKGLLLNIELLFFAAIGVAVLSTLIALARTLHSPVMFPLRFVAAAYTDLFRGIPLLLVLLLIGFGVPGLGLFGWINPLILGWAALVINYSAYVAEVIRAGILSVHPSQRAAARSLGLTYGQTMRLVILPQAIRKVIPPLMNDFVALQKDVGMVSVLGVLDAVRAAQIQVAMSFNFTPYVVAACLFIAMSWPVIRVTDWYSNRRRRREESSGVV
ncbi:MAG: amino acid ABC transporter permease [Coriobacteriia bacterium]|nr:amino acid ABC transporter permease [Coriobacteriia bacterium]